MKGMMQIAGKDTVETARQLKAEQREMLEKKRGEEKEEKEAAKEAELFARHREQEEEQEKLLQEWGDIESDLPSNSDDIKTSNNNWINQQN